MADETKMATISDALTGEIVERELTIKEISDLEVSKLAHEASQAKAQAKLDARSSALAKLAALGLTEAEIAAL
jgi:DNA-binding NarL/FixJ family response regulator